MDSGDRIEILWQGGVTSGIYVDHRQGGRVMIEGPDHDPWLMARSDFGKHSLRGGAGSEWGGPLDIAYEQLLAQGLVDDTTADPADAPQAEADTA